MKSNTVYFIEFTKKVDTGNDDFTHPIYNELSQILDDGDDKLLGFTNSENIILRLFEHKVKEICSLFEKYGFELTVSDVTDKVICGDMQLEYPEVQELTPKIFDIFRLENETIDNVLDKINERGIESLDYIDQEILKNI